MADIVNLRQTRRQKERADKEAKAAGNRIRHGRTKAEKAANAALERLTAKRLESHRRENPAAGQDDDQGSQ